MVRRQKFHPTSVLITGAAGGIGAALARVYAAPGMHLFLGDVHTAGLEAITAECRARGAETQWTEVDVTNKTAMAAWIKAADNIKLLDLVIMLAGVAYGSADQEETSEQTRRTFAINLEGMLNTIEPVLPLFRQRQRGQLALMSSHGASRGFPIAPSYSATKAAIRVYGEGLQAWLKRENIFVTVIIPGFVQTPMTDANDFMMPFRVSAAKAAAIIQQGLARGRTRICFPRPINAAVYLMSLLPRAWVDRLVALK
ncbi:MAG: SDR family NAD(P)-dependent oxidoreductase [Deltaproteobacteria bacterium]|nr:SDR family NAD(P)-dependent oxidoreductase [Deltaproteobacteria bacterium]MBI4795410.1 SDR family NAD(P)-dependent oxidoreductase [Deltaproteobacteria bacterium]